MSKQNGPDHWTIIRQASSAELLGAKAGAICDRRRFLSVAALASLTAAATGSTGLARAAEPISGIPARRDEPYLNIRNFGARGNGKTDDTAATQKALDAAGKQMGHEVLLPTGDYLIKGALNVPANVALQG